MTRVSVVGAGYFGAFHYDAWSRIDGAEMVALADTDPVAAKAMAARWSVPAVYADAGQMVAETAPDLVDITTPPATHLPILQVVAGQVPWVICQKPFCGSLEGARAAVALAEERGTRIVVHENIRFQPWYRAIAGALGAGAIGTVYQATFRLRPGDGQGPDAYLARQPYFQGMERFLVHETAVHWIDTFRYLFGEVRAVWADLRRRNPAIAGEDAGLIHMTFGDDVVGIFDGNRLADHAAENTRLTMGEMVIDGSDGTMALDGFGAVRVRARGAPDWRTVPFTWSDHLFGGDCVYLTNRAALDAFRGGLAAENEAGAYLRNLEIVEAIYRSSAEGRRINL